MKNIIITITLLVISSLSFSQNCDNVFTPNVFTPNGDGVNDIWEPVYDGSDTSKYEIFIYNRNGSLVFNSIGKSWDGSTNGDQPQNSVYAYIVYVDKCRITGTITLLK